MKAKQLLLLTIILFHALISGCSQKEGVQKIMPNFGNVSGNDDVAFVGKGFKPGIEVRFGNSKAKKITIESDTKLRVKTPSHPAGIVDITIIDDSGKARILKKAFTYRKNKK